MDIGGHRVYALLIEKDTVGVVLLYVSIRSPLGLCCSEEKTDFVGVVCLWTEAVVCSFLSQVLSSELVGFKCLIIGSRGEVAYFFTIF